jgi:C1A family cysteine protease
LAKSPAILGVDWLDSMFYTHDYKGSTFIKFDPTSAIAGGHAILAFAADLNKKCPDGSTGALELQQSWGQTWGRKGRAWLPFTAVAALLAEAGECCMSSELFKR